MATRLAGKFAMIILERFTKECVSSCTPHIAEHSPEAAASGQAVCMQKEKAMTTRWAGDVIRDTITKSPNASREDRKATFVKHLLSKAGRGDCEIVIAAFFDAHYARAEASAIEACKPLDQRIAECNARRAERQRRKEEEERFIAETAPKVRAFLLGRLRDVGNTGAA